jgi:hypothetical protein
MTTERRAERRRVATAYVEAVNANTVCADCGGGPIEWHHPDHPSQPNSRVSSLRAQGATVERIRREMERCTPLCRSCHMKADGRAAALFAAQPNQPGVSHPPKPCRKCGLPYKPLRRGLCARCYGRKPPADP